MQQVHRELHMDFDESDQGFFWVGKKWAYCDDIKVCTEMEHQLLNSSGQNKNWGHDHDRTTKPEGISLMAGQKTLY